MLKRLIKKLVARYQRNKPAEKNLLRKENNRKQIALILKDIEGRAY